MGKLNFSKGVSLASCDDGVYGRAEQEPTLGLKLARIFRFHHLGAPSEDCVDMLGTGSFLLSTTVKMCTDVGFAETKLFWPVVSVTMTSYQVTYFHSHFPEETSENEG